MNKLAHEDFTLDGEETSEDTKSVLDGFKAEISNQEKGAIEQLPSEKIENINQFLGQISIDGCVIRAQADGFSVSESTKQDVIPKSNELLKTLKTRGFDITKIPNLDSLDINTRLAWSRALSLLNQLSAPSFEKIKDKVSFEVTTTSEKDDRGTYRFASFDAIIKNGSEQTTIDNIQDGNIFFENEDNAEDNTEEAPIEEDNWENISNPPQEMINVLKQTGLVVVPLYFKIRLVDRTGKQRRKYFVKKTQYKWNEEEQKVKISGTNWMLSTKKLYKERDASKAKKLYSIPISLQKDISSILPNVTTLPKAKKPMSLRVLDYLNFNVAQDPMYALTQLQNKYIQKKNGESYFETAKLLQDLLDNSDLPDNSEYYAEH